MNDQSPELDFQMVEDLGFEIITGNHESHQAWKELRVTVDTNGITEVCVAN